MFLLTLRGTLTAKLLPSVVARGMPLANKNFWKVPLTASPFDKQGMWVRSWVGENGGARSWLSGIGKTGHDVNFCQGSICSLLATSNKVYHSLDTGYKGVPCVFAMDKITQGYQKYFC